MKRECVDAVEAAIGRTLKTDEAKGIENRIMRHMAHAKKADPNGFLSKSGPERLYAAAEGAAKELLSEVAKKQQRVALTILAHDRIQTHMADMAAAGVTGLDALKRMVAFHADTKGNFQSIETQARAIENDALRQMVGMLEASNPKFFGLFENAEGVRAITKEIFGEDSGIVEAKKGAQEWKTVTAGLRERFNRNGGDVGALDDWGMPHHHSQAYVAKAGRDQWVADTLPELNRAKYLDDNGMPMSDQQIADFLGHAWETIATGGANKLDPGRPAIGGMRANRGNESRQIHFKDADSYMRYQAKYGESSLYEVLTGHISGISKDIALVETFGPNADLTYRLFRNKAVQEATIANPTQLGKIEQEAIKADGLYNIVAGRSLPLASERLAKSFDTLRSWLIASRLGSAVVTSMSDEATLHLTARINNLPHMRILANELAALNPANQMEKRMALRAGLSMNTLISSLNRFGQEGLGPSFSSKMANSVMRASGLNALTNARKRAFGVTMFSSIGQITKEFDSLASLDVHDNRILLSKGVSETDFAVWKKATLEDWGDGNDTMLTPESIYRIPDQAIREVVSKEIDEIRADSQAQIAELNARNQQEAGWIESRADKIRSAQDAGNRLIKKLAKTREQKGQAYADAVQSRIDLMNAQLEHARVRADIDAYLLTEEAQGKAKQFLRDVEDGADIERGTRSERVHPDRLPDAVVEVFSKRPGVGEKSDAKVEQSLRERGTIGERLGRKEGSIKRRITELEQRVRDAERENASYLSGKVKDEMSRIDAMRADFAEFNKRSADRQQRRQLVMDRIARDIEPSIANAVQRAKERAATKLLGIVLEETDMAVIEPGARERAITTGGLQRGTWRGELTRSFFLFKSFPLAMIARHWMRGMDMETAGGKAAYIGTLMAATTVMGAVSMQINEVLSGRDPRNLNPAAKSGVRNWIGAMLKGGSLGIYGDFLFSESTQYGQSPVASVMGPVIGLGESFFNLTQGNIVQAALDKKTHAGAELVKFVKGNTPGASLWYAKAALDRIVFHQLQEYFSPGYLATMRARSQREFGQRWWWEPGQVTPERAPDLTAVAGEK